MPREGQLQHGLLTTISARVEGRHPGGRRRSNGQGSLGWAQPQDWTPGGWDPRLLTLVPVRRLPSCVRAAASVPPPSTSVSPPSPPPAASASPIKCPAVLNGEIPALDVTGFRQTAMNCRDSLAPRFERSGIEITDHRHRRLLRARRDRPHDCRAAQPRNELPPPHQPSPSTVDSLPRSTLHVNGLPTTHSRFTQAPSYPNQSPTGAQPSPGTPSNLPKSVTWIYQPLRLAFACSHATIQQSTIRSLHRR
jgi:hypothetical protein